ncbi:MAG: FHA domain-containing protein [Isosphaeraceae bacterium]
MEIEGYKFKKLRIAKKQYHIQIPDGDGGWHTLYQIAGTGNSPAFGRSFDPQLQAMRSVALKHVKFENTSQGLHVRPYDTLNGVYRKINRPTELRPGSRFRIGNYIMTFRESLMAEPGEPRIIEGERLLARDLKPLGAIEFLRPDGRPGVRYPILKPSGVVLGKGGVDQEGREAPVDLFLGGDPKVSARHARLAPEGLDGDLAYLEDLESKSGTWLFIEDRSPVAHGDVFWLGELYLRVVEQR